MEAKIPITVLRSAFKYNKDGWGLMRRGRKGPVVHKSMGSFQEFLRVYSRHYAKYECAVHFRFATQGEKNIANAHPVEVSRGIYMMHNGMIWDTPMYDPQMSDTWNFGQVIKTMVELDWLRDSRWQALARMAIGPGNKLVFLDEDGFVILNRNQGVDYSGCWYSNTYAWDAPKHLLPKEEGDKQIGLFNTDPSMLRWWEEQLLKGAISITDVPDEVLEKLTPGGGNKDSEVEELEGVIYDL